MNEMIYVAILITFLAYVFSFEAYLIQMVAFIKMLDGYSNAVNLWRKSPRFIHTYRFATVVCVIVSMLVMVFVIWCCYLTYTYVMLYAMHHLHDHLPIPKNYFVTGLLYIGIVLLSILNILVAIHNLTDRPKQILRLFIQFNKKMEFINYLKIQPNRFYIAKILSKLTNSKTPVVYSIYIQKSGYILIPSFGIEFLITGKTIIIRDIESKEIKTYKNYLEFIKSYKGTNE